MENKKAKHYGWSLMEVVVHPRYSNPLEFNLCREFAYHVNFRVAFQLPPCVRY